MKSFVKRNEDRDIKRKKLFLDRKKAIIRNELYVKNNKKQRANRIQQKETKTICVDLQDL